MESSKTSASTERTSIGNLGQETTDKTSGAGPTLTTAIDEATNHRAETNAADSSLINISIPRNYIIIALSVVIGVTLIIVVIVIVYKVRRKPPPREVAIEMANLPANPVREIYNDPYTNNPYTESLYNEPVYDNPEPYNGSENEPFYNEIEVTNAESARGPNYVTEYRNVVQVVTFDQNVQLYRQIDKPPKRSDDF